MLRNLLAAVGGVALFVLLGGFLIAWTGTYDVAADSGHGYLDRFAKFTRESSVAARDGDIVVPPLDNPLLIATGAEHYNHMCTGCHLAPGLKDNDMRQGMNPEPPRLAERRHPNAQEDFWIVKHGIKMTAMPAWGPSHSDQTLWAIVAFLQKLPSLNAAQYDAMVHDGEPQHGGADGEDAHSEPPSAASQTLPESMPATPPRAAPPKGTAPTQPLH